MKLGMRWELFYLIWEVAKYTNWGYKNLQRKSSKPQIIYTYDSQYLRLTNVQNKIEHKISLKVKIPI